MTVKSSSVSTFLAFAGIRFGLAVIYILNKKKKNSYENNPELRKQQNEVNDVSLCSTLSISCEILIDCCF